MIGHNSNNLLMSKACEINEQHKGMLAAIEDSETRAKRIGQALIDLQPTLKEVSVSLTNFCKEHLPFGKSAAYEFIKIAKGKTTLAQENARKYSAPAEKSLGQQELPSICEYMEFHRGLAHLRAMFWVDAGSEHEEWRSPLIESISDFTVKSSGLPINKSDFAMASEALAKMTSEGLLETDSVNSTRSLVLTAVEYAVEQTDLYRVGYPFVMNIVKSDETRTKHILEGNIGAAKAVTDKQQVHADVLGMSLETVRMLHGLLTNHDANLTGLIEGGHPSGHHPLWSAYKELLHFEPLKEQPSGNAEEWCAEAMVMTALGFIKDDESSVDEVLGRFESRQPFWLMACEASRTVQKHLEKRVHSEW